MTKNSPKPDDADYYNWEAFTRFAENFNISLDHVDDYGDWWECWKAGYIAGVNH